MRSPVAKKVLKSKKEREKTGQYESIDGKELRDRILYGKRKGQDQNKMDTGKVKVVPPEESEEKKTKRALNSITRALIRTEEKNQTEKKRLREKYNKELKVLQDQLKQQAYELQKARQENLNSRRQRPTGRRSRSTGPYSRRPRRRNLRQNTDVSNDEEEMMDDNEDTLMSE